jgi:hypothetical protein
VVRLTSKPISPSPHSSTPTQYNILSPKQTRYPGTLQIEQQRDNKAEGPCPENRPSASHVEAAGGQYLRGSPRKAVVDWVLGWRCGPLSRVGFGVPGRIEVGSWGFLCPLAEIYISQSQLWFHMFYIVCVTSSSERCNLLPDRLPLHRWCLALLIKTLQVVVL